MVDSPLAMQNGNNLRVFFNFRSCAFGGISLANYSMQNIFKSANSIIENRKHIDRARISFASRDCVRPLGKKTKQVSLITWTNRLQHNVAVKVNPSESKEAMRCSLPTWHTYNQA